MALRSITEGAGPHSMETWKAAASCAVEHFVQQEVFLLKLWGYQVLNNKMWAGQGAGPLSLKVSTHIEQAGHTWYILECELVALADGQEPWI